MHKVKSPVRIMAEADGDDERGEEVEREFVHRALYLIFLPYLFFFHFFFFFFALSKKNILPLSTHTTRAQFTLCVHNTRYVRLEILNTPVLVYV